MFILPVNSALNPFLYTLTAILGKKVRVVRQDVFISDGDMGFKMVGYLRHRGGGYHRSCFNLCNIYCATASAEKCFHYKS